MTTKSRPKKTKASKKASSAQRAKHTKAKKHPVRLLKKQTTRLTASEIKKEFTEEKVDLILKKGRERGFVTYAEILNTFPRIEYNILFLEDLYARFEGAGIDVLEGQELLTPTGKPTRKKGRDAEDPATDAVQMYLREIGKISLLKAEEEKDRGKKKRGSRTP